MAPMQQTKIVVNGYTDNVPIGPELVREGITSNLILSQKRADNVMNFMTSQGVNPALVSAQGSAMQTRLPRTIAPPAELRTGA
ncbi:MAG: OmpA family protein [Deltaproteobacteria bacterium]|nr:OmpA family protein [Deltaproteobacteria bacterium]